MARRKSPGRPALPATDRLELRIPSPEKARLLEMVEGEGFENVSDWIRACIASRYEAFRKSQLPVYRLPLAHIAEATRVLEERGIAETEIETLLVGNQLRRLGLEHHRGALTEWLNLELEDKARTDIMAVLGARGIPLKDVPQILADPGEMRRLGLLGHQAALTDLVREYAEHNANDDER